MRRRIILILVVVSTFSIPAFGQVSIGIVGFPQISALTSKSMRQDSVLSNKITFSGGAGLMLGYGFSETWGVQVGALYSAQSQTIRSNYTLNGESFTHTGKKRFDYLKIPVMLKYSKPLGALTFNLFGGPQLSYLIKYDGGMVVYIPDQYFDLPVTPTGNSYYKKIVVDLTAGAGLDIPLSNTFDLTTGLKIDYSVTDAENKSATFEGRDLTDLNGQGDGPARNITYALLVGISYRFGNANDLIAPSNKFRGRSYGKKRRF